MQEVVTQDILVEQVDSQVGGMVGNQAALGEDNFDQQSSILAEDNFPVWLAGYLAVEHSRQPEVCLVDADKHRCMLLVVTVELLVGWIGMKEAAVD